MLLSGLLALCLAVTRTSLRVAVCQDSDDRPSLQRYSRAPCERPLFQSCVFKKSGCYLYENLAQSQDTCPEKPRKRKGEPRN